MAIVYYARGHAQTLPRVKRARIRCAPAPDVYGRLLGALIDATDFPALTMLVRAGVFDEDDESWEVGTFDLGLHDLLAGVEARLGGRGPTGARPRPRGRKGQPA
jgi:hypothetical protein